ncbi:unnamed protein product [Parnassius apollo]|uniref:(apollo) hypothetical protein n=1 Tax=Parnassius apollo TaxID=110799 RepID=A0A8S3W0G5_PARAO|nr:unnamed protein product [Parnassius apollo]
MHRLFAELEPSITDTEHNLADQVQIYLMSPNSNGQDLRLFPHRMKMLRLRMRRHKLQSNPQTLMLP